MLKLLRHNNRGDTIVEVMIVLAVLGLAIGISYATANRSLLNARQAQENSAATGRAQSQVEALAKMAGNGSTAPDRNIFQSGPYCLVPTGTPLDPYQVSLNITAEDTAGGCTATGTVPYQTQVTYESADDTFRVSVSWPDVNGSSVPDNVTIIYRIHRPS